MWSIGVYPLSRWVCVGVEGRPITKDRESSFLVLALCLHFERRRRCHRHKSSFLSLVVRLGTKMGWRMVVGRRKLILEKPCLILCVCVCLMRACERTSKTWTRTDGNHKREYLVLLYNLLCQATCICAPGCYHSRHCHTSINNQSFIFPSPWASLSSQPLNIT